MSARSCEHADQECGPCFRERIGSVQTAASATPSRMIARKPGVQPKEKPSYNEWERGIPKDHRDMPYLTKSGALVGNKQFAETRRDYRQFR